MSDDLDKRYTDPEPEDEDIDCAEQYDHGCQNCPDYDCPYRDVWWTDPMDEEYGQEWENDHEWEDIEPEEDHE